MRMEEKDIEVLIYYYHLKLQETTTSFHRYLYDQINWSSRLIGIKGARGVGKTTMILQYIKEHFSNVDEALYASLDNMWFSVNTLYSLAIYAHTHGITHLFLDEVHRYKNWSQEIKMIYDSMPDLKVVYTSSSMLEVERSKVDLSRRQSVYHLYGMSFREYLEYEGVVAIEPMSLETLLSQHVKIAMDITSKIKVLPQFEKYQQRGYYPFYKEAGAEYWSRLQEVVKIIIEVDLPAVTEISFPTMEKTKQLLMYIAQSKPLEVKLRTLFSAIETSRETGLFLLNMLEKADLLMLFSTKKPNYKNLKIPEKIYLQNANLMQALTKTTDIGTARETFFLNQLSVNHSVLMPQTGDFNVDDQWLFEVGGANKTFDQIANLPDSYLAVDNTDMGYGHRIPLWMFGLLY